MRKIRESIEEFGEPETPLPLDISKVVCAYKAWVTIDKRLVFKMTKKTTGKIKYKAVKAAMRGNEYYVERTKECLQKRIGHIPDYSFYQTTSHAVEKSPLVFVTLTYEERKLEEKWHDIGKDFNRFLSGIRREFGEAEFLRVWESHESGMPHVHVVFRLPKDLPCMALTGRSGRRTWRVIGEDRNRIRRHWKHGFSDVKSIASTDGMCSYVMKYLEKDVLGGEGEKHVLTVAMLWHFEKRAYSISRRFFEDCKPRRPDLNIMLHNSTWIVEYLGVMWKDEAEEWIRESIQMDRAILRHRLQAGLEAFFPAP